MEGSPYPRPGITCPLCGKPFDPRIGYCPACRERFLKDLEEEGEARSDKDRFMWNVYACILGFLGLMVLFVSIQDWSVPVGVGLLVLSVFLFAVANLERFFRIRVP